MFIGRNYKYATGKGDSFTKVPGHVPRENVKEQLPACSGSGDAMQYRHYVLKRSKKEKERNVKATFTKEGTDVSLISCLGSVLCLRGDELK